MTMTREAPPTRCDTTNIDVNGNCNCVVVVAKKGDCP
jgi:hypothetical protein